MELRSCLFQLLVLGRLLMRSRGNVPVNDLPENPRKDVREELFSERMGPAVEESGEHVVVRVELLQIVISALVGWNAPCQKPPRLISLLQPLRSVLCHVFSPEANPYLSQRRSADCQH